MALRVLIVDDCEKDRIVLRYILEQIKDINIVGEAVHGLEAIMRCQEKKIDLVFLDIAMPELDGIETASRILAMKDSPLIVFVTAQSGMAAKAYDLGVLDYIIKPIEKKRVQKTIYRAQERLNHREAIARKVQLEMKNQIAYIMSKYNENEAYLRRLPIRQKGKINLVKHDDIIACESKGKKVYIHTKNGGYLTGYTLHELEKRLDEAYFFRCHQAYLVNLNYIQEIKNFGEGSYVLTLYPGDHEITLSRSKFKQLRDKTGI